MVDKLLGKAKDGSDIKKKYLKMLISSQIDINKG
jgi:hypothetical protein